MSSHFMLICVKGIQLRCEVRCGPIDLEAELAKALNRQDYEMLSRGNRVVLKPRTCVTLAIELVPERGGTSAAEAGFDPSPKGKKGATR